MRRGVPPDACTTSPTLLTTSNGFPRETGTTPKTSITNWHMRFHSAQLGLVGTFELCGMWQQLSVAGAAEGVDQHAQGYRGDGADR